MVDNIRFSDLAQNELEESAVYYEEQLLGLGEQFTLEIHKAAETVARNPESYPKKEGNLRAFVVQRFSFIIVYEYFEEENSVYLLHVFHTSRDPKYKYKSKGSL